MVSNAVVCSEKHLLRHELGVFSHFCRFEVRKSSPEHLGYVLLFLLRAGPVRSDYESPLSVAGTVNSGNVSCRQTPFSQSGTIHGSSGLDYESSRCEEGESRCRPQGRLDLARRQLRPLRHHLREGAYVEKRCAAISMVEVTVAGAKRLCGLPEERKCAES